MHRKLYVCSYACPMDLLTISHKQGDIAPMGEGVAALSPKVVRLSDDMRSFNGTIMDAQILTENGTAMPADDHDRRFFEGAWVHTYNGTYYL